MSLSHPQTFAPTTTREILEQLAISVNSILQKTEHMDFVELEKEMHQEWGETYRQYLAKLL